MTSKSDANSGNRIDLFAPSNKKKI